MKLRIEDNSIRFRITPEELARLNDEGRVESATQIHSEDGGRLEGEFIYALAVDLQGGATQCRIEPSFILFILHPDDLALLNARGEDGFLYERESIAPEGDVKQFKAYVEVDRHGKRPRRNP